VRLGVLLDRVGDGLGGAETHTRRLLARAVARDLAPVVACLSGTAGPGVETLLVSAPRCRPARDRTFARDGIRRLREAQADVVLAFRHAPGCDVYLPHGGLVADTLLARNHSHRTWAPRRLARALSPKTRFFLEAERAVLSGPRGPRVICVSQALATRMRARYPAALPRMEVVPNGVDGRHFEPLGFRAAGVLEREALGLERPRAYVGLLLACDPVLKGAEVAVESLAEEGLGALDPPFHLIVAGARLPAWLRRRARRLGVAGRIHEVGYRPDPRPLYAAADVLVHPTFHDPCSLACLEALATGVPVITTPANGVGELMGQRGGIVVEAVGDPSAVAVAVAVLADPLLRAATAEDARRVALGSDETRRLDRVLEICGEVAGPPAVGP